MQFRAVVGSRFEPPAEIFLTMSGADKGLPAALLGPLLTPVVCWTDSEAGDGSLTSLDLGLEAG